MFVRACAALAASAAIAAMMLMMVSCAQPPQEIEVTREVEVSVEVTREVKVTVEIEREVTVDVTREVVLTREIPITVEVEKHVEVTREVPITVEVDVTREVPVTVEVERQIEVTREVPATVIVEITREVEVEATRQVEVTREVPVTVEVTREVSVGIEGDGGNSAVVSIFEGMNDASVAYCKEYIDATDDTSSFRILDPINVALGNIEWDDMSPEHLFRLSYTALTSRYAARNYLDQAEDDPIVWGSVAHAAETALYEYCVAAVVYAET